MSESEEMYLVTIAQLSEIDPGNPVPMSKIASHLGIKSVSANEMVRKLEEVGCLLYTPYKGIELTPQGIHRASQVLRKRRLWEVFLYEYLHMTIEEAAEIACHLEHALPCQAIERLAEFLGSPVLSPSGKPIPRLDDTNLEPGEIPLRSLETSEPGEVTRIIANSGIRSFLANHGIKPGANIIVLAIAGDGDRLISDEHHNTIHIAKNLVDSIFIKR